MKRVLTEHDTGSAACPKCHKLAPMTYRYRDISLAAPKVRVKHVLVGVCVIPATAR